MFLKKKSQWEVAQVVIVQAIRFASQLGTPELREPESSIVGSK